MSEPAYAEPKTSSSQTTAADERVLAQVEKWMAMIREISGEQQREPKLRS